MNFKKMLMLRLTEEGMFDNDAIALVDAALADKTFCPEMATRWHHEVDGYPAGISASVYTVLRPFAFKWISEHQPNTWYRPAFAPGVSGLEGGPLEKFITDFWKENRKL